MQATLAVLAARAEREEISDKVKKDSHGDCPFFAV